MSKDWTIQLMDKLAGELSEKEAAQFEAETMQDEHLAEEFQFFADAWDKMEEFQVPAPQNSLSDKFYAKLDATVDRQEKALPNRLKEFFGSFMQNAPMVRNLSLGMLFLAVGFILGGKWNKKTITVNQTTVHTAAPTANGTQVSAQYASFVPATQKIQQINSIPQTITDESEALLQLKQVLQTERNTNVKLAALRQIGQHYSDSRGLKNFLARQIEQEQSPLVQVELLNLLIDNNQSKETIQTMESMLNRRQLNPVLQEKIKKDLPVLRASYVK